MSPEWWVEKPRRTDSDNAEGRLDALVRDEIKMVNRKNRENRRDAMARACRAGAAALRDTGDDHKTEQGILLLALACELDGGDLMAEAKELCEIAAEGEG